MMAIKVLAFADFIAEFTYAEEDDALDPNVKLAKEGEAEEKDGDTMRWKIFVDGSSNCHGCGVGLILQTHSGGQMEYAKHVGFKATNNEAKYEAFFAGLKDAVELGVESLDIFSDSQHVVNQVKGDYLAKDLRIVVYLDEVKPLMMKNKNFKIQQIP